MSITTAQKFSQSSGIILALKSDTNYRNNTNRVPKYLNVAWLSAFPNEDEKLFYGAYVRFKIHDIIDGNTLTQHTKELLIFNKFQRLLDNYKVQWNQEEKEVDVLLNYLKHHQGKQEVASSMNKYCLELFQYFCNHSDRKKVSILNFMKLQKEIYKVLFIEQQNNLLSFNPLIKLFPYLAKLSLNSLEMTGFLTNVRKYIKIVENYIESQEVSKFSNLSKITLESEKQKDRKINSVLMQYDSKLIGNNIQWRITYNYRYQDDGIIHSIIFSKHDNLSEEEQISFSKARVKSYSGDELLRLIENVCDESDKLFNYKQEFVSFMKQNSIDGVTFASYDRKAFGKSVADYFNNKKLNGQAKNLYTKILKECIRDYETSAKPESFTEKEHKISGPTTSADEVKERVDKRRIINPLNVVLKNSYKYDDVSNTKQEKEVMIELSQLEDNMSQEHDIEEDWDEVLDDFTHIIQDMDRLDEKNTEIIEEKETVNWKALQHIESYSSAKLLQLVQSMCEESDKLFKFKAEFITFCKYNNLDGAVFASYDRKKFGQVMVDYFDNKKLRRPSLNLYTLILQRCITFEGIVARDDLDLDNIHYVSKLNGGLISYCNEQQLIVFTKKICDEDDQLKRYKKPIISWMQRNDLNGDRCLKYDKIEFIESITSQTGLGRAAYNFYQKLSALNEEIPISRFNEFIEVINPKITDKIDKIESFKSLANHKGNINFKIFLLLLIEISNKSSSGNTQDELFVIEMAKIWDQFIDPAGNGNVLAVEWLSLMKRLDVDTLSDDKIMKMFTFMDTDNDGLIEKEDFISFAAMSIDDLHLKKLIQALISKKGNDNSEGTDCLIQ